MGQVLVLEQMSPVVIGYFFKKMSIQIKFKFKLTFIFYLAYLRACCIKKSTKIFHIISYNTIILTQRVKFGTK